MKKSGVFGLIAIICGFVGLLLRDVANSDARWWSYVVIVALVAFFTWLSTNTAVKKETQEKFQGRAIEELPDGAEFKKIDQLPSLDELPVVSSCSIHLLLKRVDVDRSDSYIKLYRLNRYLLVDADGKELPAVPEKFSVKKGTKGQLSKARQFEEVGETYKVYYLIPKQENK